ncbi:hypothetical protein C0991_004098 [Blastosporella zonata]|nr:hypothetical protein C0991_004098 [Blastosporella zonata]
MAPPKLSTKAPTHQACIAAIEAVLSPAIHMPITHKASAALVPIFSTVHDHLSEAIPLLAQAQTQYQQTPIRPTGTANLVHNVSAVTCPNPHPPSMNRQPPYTSQKIHIWQQNVQKSLTAQTNLINNIKPEAWDIIALQEPYINSYGNTMANNT